MAFALLCDDTARRATLSGAMAKSCGMPLPKESEALTTARPKWSPGCAQMPAGVKVLALQAKCHCHHPQPKANTNLMPTSYIPTQSKKNGYPPTQKRSSGCAQMSVGVEAQAVPKKCSYSLQQPMTNTQLTPTSCVPTPSKNTGCPLLCMPESSNKPKPHSLLSTTQKDDACRRADTMKDVMPTTTLTVKLCMHLCSCSQNSTNNTKQDPLHDLGDQVTDLDVLLFAPRVGKANEQHQSRPRSLSSEGSKKKKRIDA